MKTLQYKVFKKRTMYSVGGLAMKYQGRYKSKSGNWWYVFTAHGGVFEIPAYRTKQIKGLICSSQSG